MTVATHRPPPPMMCERTDRKAYLHICSGILDIVPTSRRPAHTHRRELTLDEHVAVMADLFDLLSDPTRLRLLLELRERAEACVSDLAGVTDTTESAVSHALRLLRTAGLVAAERRGRHIYYRLADEHARVVLDATLTHFRTAHDTAPGRRSRSRPRPSVA